MMIRLEMAFVLMLRYLLVFITQKSAVGMEEIALHSTPCIQIAIIMLINLETVFVMIFLIERNVDLMVVTAFNNNNYK